MGCSSSTGAAEMLVRLPQSFLLCPVQRQLPGFWHQPKLLELCGDGLPRPPGLPPCTSECVICSNISSTCPTEQACEVSAPAFRNTPLWLGSLVPQGFGQVVSDLHFSDAIIAASFRPRGRHKLEGLRNDLHQDAHQLPHFVHRAPPRRFAFRVEILGLSAAAVGCLVVREVGNHGRWRVNVRHQLPPQCLWNARVRLVACAASGAMGPTDCCWNLLALKFHSLRLCLRSRCWLWHLGWWDVRLAGQLIKQSKLLL
mmetsp:Transcript_10663/g.32049  ORF Transcript_10663/g.32049 Transcript_10663/m.32049 type:complete len:256 (-) Transcript_10663:395-1162(-)